jgi:hypothetical protein
MMSISFPKLIQTLCFGNDILAAFPGAARPIESLAKNGFEVYGASPDCR